MQMQMVLDFQNGVSSLAAILYGDVAITEFGWSSQVNDGSCRTKFWWARRLHSGNPRPFASAFGYGEFVMATGLVIDWHSRKLFGLEPMVLLNIQDILPNHWHAPPHHTGNSAKSLAHWPQIDRQFCQITGTWHRPTVHIVPPGTMVPTLGT